MELITNIFENNDDLVNDVPEFLFEMFLGLIVDEGRQSKFLRFFQVIQYCQGVYQMDNQMKVLNAFIPN